jgi:hypothetical protein
MNLDNWHLIFVSTSMILVVVASIPLITAYLPSTEEPFFALALLGEEGMAEHYYPQDNPNLIVGEEVHWTIYLYNHVGEVQYVAVQVKLLNSSMPAPNSTSCTPSPAPVVYEVRRVMLDNETWLHPLIWSIEEISSFEDFVEIERLSMNDGSFETDVFAEKGINYRFVFELWVYDESLSEFQFGWSYGYELRSAWNQIWFNSTSLTVS